MKDRSFRLIHWFSITLFLRKTSQESINLERKSYLDCSSDTHRTRREFGRVTYWVADIEELETMDASEIYSKRLNAKEVIFYQKVENSFFQPQMDESNFPATFIREHPFRGEGHKDFLGESEGSLPPPQDSLPDASEAINDFWSMSGNFKTAITLNPEANFTRREKNHSLFH